MVVSEWDTFSTKAITPTQRVARWCSYGSETFSHMVVKPKRPPLFEATLSRIKFGPLGFARLTTSATTAYGGIGGSNGWAVPDNDALLLVLVESGRSILEQDNVTSEIKPGDIVFRDLTRPWKHECEDNFAVTNIKIPYTSLLPFVDDPARLLGSVFPGAAPQVALIAGIIRTVHKALQTDSRHEWTEGLEDLILGSIKAIGSKPLAVAVRERTRREEKSIRRRAMSFIAQYIADEDLSVSSLTKALSITERTLQRAFVETGITPSGYIRNQRLDHAALKLMHADANQTVLDIALSVGFSDASYFSRSFAKRYGTTPGRYQGSAPMQEASVRLAI